jgi:hypothetical protein
MYTDATQNGSLDELTGNVTQLTRSVKNKEWTNHSLGRHEKGVGDVKLSESYLNEIVQAFSASRMVNNRGATLYF